MPREPWRYVEYDAAPIPSVAHSLNTLGLCLDTFGRFPEALPKVQEALAINQRLFPEAHPEVAKLQLNVATMLVRARRPQEALPLYEEALAALRELFEQHKGGCGGVWWACWRWSAACPRGGWGRGSGWWWWWLLLLLLVVVVVVVFWLTFLSTRSGRPCCLCADSLGHSQETLTIT